VIKFNPDIEIRKAANRIGEELGIDPIIVLDVYKNYLVDLSHLMKCDLLPYIRIHEIGNIVGVPEFIRRRILSLNTRQPKGFTYEIDRLEVIKNRLLNEMKKYSPKKFERSKAKEKARLNETGI